jgi:Tol biopolymer transport system component
VLFVVVSAASCGGRTAGGGPIDTPPAPPPVENDLRHPQETHLGSIKQLTHGGENAEAYWSFDGKQLIYQSTHGDHACDQIFTTSVDNPAEPGLVSTGRGRTTCAYFFPGDRSIVYASTHHASDECPPPPDHSQGYVWALYDYDIYGARADGSEPRRLTDSPGYDAEATVCPVDGSIVFTSTRDGDLELYRMDPDGKNVRRLTHTPGYDGGAFFSADCKKLVWRASRPEAGKELDDYKRLLAQNLVRPTKLEIMVANADGSEPQQVTYLDAASFAPYFFPSGERIIFSTNYGDPKGREFDIWAIDVDGTDLERITFTPGFDGFPMFSPDGSRLAFASNRNQANEGDTDVYVATWTDGPAAPGEKSAADRFLEDVRWLADDAREGRGVGSQGLDASADWLAERMKAIGLEPAGDGGGYKQAFEVPVAVRAAPETTVEIDGVAIPADAFTALGFSASADVTADVIAAGYGITAPSLKIDDYKGVKAKGKIVVVRRFVPDDEKLADPEHERRYGDPRYKAWNAREHGAKGLIIVDVPVVKEGKEVPADAALPRLSVDHDGDAGIPVVVLTRAAGGNLLDGSIKRKKAPRARLRVKLELEKRAVHNVVGLLRGTHEKPPGGVVIVGAHYDHLGLGGPASLAPGVSAPHNGADDNASGTAALLQVAERLTARRTSVPRDVYFVAFTAEEMGVLGSTAFVRKPPAGLVMTDVVAMLNMDMVGRLRANTLVVRGTESAAEWTDLVTQACGRGKLACELGGDGWGPSDHTPFYAAGVPVLHFFTGAHREYHTPSDDAPLINAAGGARVAQVVADVAELAANGPRMTYKAVPTPPPQGDVRNKGASLGTVPDYAGPPEGKSGVLLAGVRPGGPADLAGLRRGDLLVKIATYEIRNVDDFMFVLRSSTPGQKVKVTVERDGKRVTVDVVLGQPTRR